MNLPPFKVWRVVRDEYELQNCRKRARGCLFSKNPMKFLEDENSGRLFNDRDIANILCGFMDLEEEANKRLQEIREQWISIKSTNEKIRELMRDPETAFDWEIELANGLSSVDAKSVTVEFEFNGKKATGKMDPDVIRIILKDNSYFSSCNFTVAKQGRQIINDLGAGSWGNTLKCEHIVRITYGKKELYVRKH